MWKILVITFAIGNQYSVAVYPKETFKSESECLTYIGAYHSRYPAEKELITALTCLPESNIKTFISSET